MSVVKELLRAEGNETISFGDYTLPEKKKKADFAFQGALYKVKTCQEITRLERDDAFVFESVPGTAVNELTQDENGISFLVEGDQDAQITVGLAESTAYDIKIDGADAGVMKTNMGGKLSFSVELEKSEQVKVEITLSEE